MTELRRDMANQQHCFWEGGGEHLIVGVVGGGGGFNPLLDVIDNPLLYNYLPQMRLAAVSEMEGSPASLARAKGLGVPAYNDCDDMLAANPDINLLVELTGSPERLDRLRKSVPPEISILDRREIVFLCSLHDLTQMKHRFRTSLERQRTLLHSVIDEIREDVLVLDLEAGIEDLNRNVWKRAGCSRDDLVGLRCWRAVNIDEGVMFCSELDKDCPFRETRLTRAKSEALFTRLDDLGRLRYFRVYAYPIFTVGGYMSHIMVMRRDITERTRREKLEQHHERLAVVGEMSAYLAHEIRNPLCAIGGYANALLRSERLGEGERDKVRIMVEETTRLERILSSILNFTRPGEMKTGPVDLATVAEETIELMRAGYAKTGCSFLLRRADGAPLVKGNADILKQCLINLLKNAVEAMPDGGEIIVRLDSDKRMVRLEVEDRGVGMSRKEADRVFSPFFTTKEEGTGLGLAMIKKNVDELGGEVFIRSRPGEGTTVTLLLPPMLAEAENDPAPSLSASPEKPGEFSSA